MSVLHCMKVGCVVTALGRPKEWLDDIGKWLWQAQPPLLVMLHGVMGYCLCCLAARFRVPSPPSPTEQDFDDRSRAPSSPPTR